MRARFELETHDLGGRRTERGGPVEHSAGRPFGMRPVRSRHVFRHRAVRAAMRTAAVRGHPLALEEAFDAARGKTNLDLLPDERVRHAVVMAIDLDVVIDVGAGLLPVRVLEGRRRQGSERRTVQGLVGVPAAAGELSEGPAIEVVDETGDSLVQFGQREEAPVSEPGEDPPLDDLYADLDLGFVLRAIGTRRQDGGAIVRREFGHRPLWFGFVTVGLADQRPWIVGNDQFGHSADKLERPAQAVQPVGLSLGGRGAGIGVVRGTEHGDEDVGPANFARGGVDDRDGIASVIGKQFLAGPVRLPHRTLESLGIVPVKVAETRVLVGRLAPRLPILFPEQRQGDAVLLQFLVNRREIGRHVPAGFPAPDAKSQTVLQRLFIQRPDLLPIQPRHLCRLDVLGDNALR